MLGGIIRCTRAHPWTICRFLMCSLESLSSFSLSVNIFTSVYFKLLYSYLALSQTEGQVKGLAYKYHMPIYFLLLIVSGCSGSRLNRVFQTSLSDFTVGTLTKNYFTSYCSDNSSCFCLCCWEVVKKVMAKQRSELVWIAQRECFRSLQVTNLLLLVWI